VDFASHEPVSAQALERFEVDPQDGPDLDDLHFDVAKGMRSQWNKTALQLIQLRLGKSYTRMEMTSLRGPNNTSRN
jgi:hypothetical protein